jgi:hypothetical protein
MSTQALKNGKTIQELTGFTDSIRITHADLTDTDTAETINLAVKAGTQVRNVAFKLHTAFDGGSTSNLTLQVGDSADVDAFVSNSIIHVDSTEENYGPSVAAGVGGKLGKVFAADGNINMLFTSTGANINVLDAGDIEIFFNLVHVDEFAGRQVS